MSSTPFILEWDQAFNRSPSTLRYRTTLNALRTYAHNDTGECWPSISTLAANTGLSRRSIQNHLSDAIQDGWLVRLRLGTNTDGRNVPSMYALSIP